jgi:predicted ATPase
LIELKEQLSDTAKAFLEKITSEGVSVKSINPELGLNFSFRMVIRDDEEAIFFMKSQPEAHGLGSDNACLWTNSKSLVLAFLAIFDEQWSKATSLKTKADNLESASSSSSQFSVDLAKLEDSLLSETEPPITGVFAEPDLVGRERELGELRSLLNSAMVGKGKTVFVSGEAGAGKTRLVTEFLKDLKDQKAIVLTGWCLSNASVPYFPFFEAFNMYFSGGSKENIGVCSESGDSYINRNAPEIDSATEIELKNWLMGPSKANLGKAQTLSPQAWKDQTFVAVAKTLPSMSEHHPIILFIDDMHWADSASIALFHYVSRVISQSKGKVLLLGTFRSDELTPDAEGHPHPLADELRMMNREELFRQIELPCLDNYSVTKIAENMLGGKINSDFARKLAKESRGNPLFIVESIRMLSERMSLVQENEQWRLSIDELIIPAKIKDIILRRLATLKRDQRRILDAACVIGEKFDVELLAAVLSLDTLTVLETLNCVAQSTSLVKCFADSFKFDHARSRETLYEEIPLPLRKGYHVRVAEKLEALGKDGKLPFGDLAYHYRRAENSEKALKYSSAAGQDALARWSNAEAIRHFAYVLQTIGDNPELVKERDIAAEGLGDALFASSNFNEATKTFEELASRTANDRLKLRALSKAREAAFRLGDAVALCQLITRSEPLTAYDRLEKAKVFVSKGALFAMHVVEPLVLEESARVAGLGNMKIAGPNVIENMKAALKIFEEEYSILDAAFALAWLATALPGQGYPEEAIADGLLSVAIANESGDIDLQQMCMGRLVQGFQTSLLEKEALLAFKEMEEIEVKTKIGAFFQLVNARLQSARGFEQTGAYDEALPFAMKALDLLRKMESKTNLGDAYSVLTRLYARLGNIKRSEEFFEKLMKVPQQNLGNVRVRLSLTKAVLCAARGQWEEANQHFKESFEAYNVPRGANGDFPATKLYYAWALEKQGRLEEAKVQLQENRKIRNQIEEKFKQLRLWSSLMVRRHVCRGRIRNAPGPD